MRRVCAWCGKILGGAEASPVPTTHGICVSCADRVEDFDFRSFEAGTARSGSGGELPHRLDARSRGSHKLSR